MPRAAGRLSLRERVVRNLNRAFCDVIRHANKESRGSDGVTVRQFTAEWRQERRRIVADLNDASYTFQPLRGVVLPKDSTKPLSETNARPISVPAVRDRVVQRAMLETLWPQIRDEVFTKWSFGGIREYKLRSGRQSLRLTSARKSVRLAATRILDLRARGLAWVFETDIKNFFPSINKDTLLGRLNAKLEDDSLDPLLRGAVSTEIGNAASLGEYCKFWDPDRGVPQGGILSPILANFYLYPFDRTLADNGFELVRYVDDLVVLTASEPDARRAYQLSLSALSALGLGAYKLEEPDAKGRCKTKLLAPGLPFDFLGVTFYRRSLEPKKSKWDDLDTRIVEATAVDVRSPKPLTDVVRLTNSIVRGWVSAFSFCNIPRDRLDAVDRRVRDRVGGWLKIHGFTSDPNVLDARRARLLGVKPAAGVEIKPLLP